MDLLRSCLERKLHVTADSNQTASWKPAIKHSSTFTSILYPPLISSLQTGSYRTLFSLYHMTYAWENAVTVKRKLLIFSRCWFEKQFLVRCLSAGMYAPLASKRLDEPRIFVFSIQEFSCHASMPGEHDHPSSKNRDPSNVAEREYKFYREPITYQ